MTNDLSPSPPPLVTVILPVRNEGEFIERSLGSVVEQTWLKRHGADRLEILVVDGRSTDDTRERVESVARSHPELCLRLLDNPGRTAPCALNVGLRQARGDVILRVDGHAEIEPGYLERAVELLEEHGADGVGGVLQTLGEGLVPRAIAAAMASRFGVGGAAFRVLPPGAPPRPSDTIAFPVYRRSAVARTGGFDEELMRDQDDEWNYRLRASGGKLLTSGDLVARYYSRSTLGRLAKQYFQYGLYKVRVLQLHPRQMSLRQFIPPTFVAALAASLLIWHSLAAWSERPFPPWLPLVAVAGSYLLANLVASVLTSLRSGIGLLPVLPMAYAILHVAYGSGFLLGFVRWRGRWRDAGQIPDLGWTGSEEEAS
ncbi:MAG: glycosyltransferase family 2 protein [Thermoanaerobaculia bacterium]|nr:glycosyltransferase family 2 protein [Thermoanaerobaculia bacterium]